MDPSAATEHCAAATRGGVVGKELKPGAGQNTAFHALHAVKFC